MTTSSNGGASPSSGVVGCLSRMGMMIFLTFVIMRIFYHIFNQHQQQHQATSVIMTPTTTSPTTPNRLSTSKDKDMKTSVVLPAHISGLKQAAAIASVSDSLIKPIATPSQHLRTTTTKSSSTGTAHLSSGAMLATMSSANSSTQQQLYLEKKKKKRFDKDHSPAMLGLSPYHYSEQENALHAVAMTWEQFINLPIQPPRHTLTIPHNVAKHLKVCASDKASGNNMLSDMDSPKPQQNITAATVANAASSRKGCNNIWNDQFLNTWKTRKVKGLCEDNANSKIRCFDSVGKSRYCIFENAMMNFRKVRKRKQQDTFVRSWERGFLSADCGDMAPDDIGYLPLYKPDIEGREDAICDYVFNETVLVYSHDNIRNYHYMISDYLNVFTMLWLSGANKHMNDVTFLNIDGMNNRKGKFNGDQINQFFKPYNVSFRRIVKAQDLAESGSKVCFKKIIMQPRPELQFQWDGIDDHHCPVTYTSSLYQRFNLQIRHQMQLLPSPHRDQDEATNPNIINVLLISRSLRPGQLVSASAVASSGSAGTASNPISGTSTSNSGSNMDYVIARLFRNEQEIVTSLEAYLKKKETELPSTTSNVKMSLKVTDLVSLPYDEQIKLISESSIVMGMFGAGIASSIHMSLGSMRYCCGVLEIFPPVTATTSSSTSAQTTSTTAATAASISGKLMNKGYSMMSRKLGYFYERLDIPALSDSSASGGSSSSSLVGSSSTGAIEMGTIVPIQPLLNTLDKLIDDIAHSEGSCLLPEVMQSPYM